jgi:mannose-6-phosphate isomerase class I
VRPWFEPGPWGGQWIKARLPELAQEVPNYAWSFELIVPENGLVFESDSRLLEVSFDCLMYQEYRAVLGECAPHFRYEFPIRYDFLDTFAGGNLSVQCHPRPAYIRRHFGETFTQDECYYLLDCEPGAQVYLGFQAGVDPAEFKAELLRSAQTARPVEVTRFVQTVLARKHDLILIPNGTIHGSGRDNLVLEISATPYIFTFKMYDWLRLDLDGKPRALNIERAFENLYFDRQGEAVPRELVAQPREIAAGPDWRLIHLPTHPEHFYDVHRFEFSGLVEAETAGSCHVMSLVEGHSVVLETANSVRRRFHYAETFVIPAAAGRYRLVSPEGAPLKVVKTFMKPAAQWAPGSAPDAD